MKVVYYTTLYPVKSNQYNAEFKKIFGLADVLKTFDIFAMILPYLSNLIINPFSKYDRYAKIAASHFPMAVVRQ